MTILSDSCVSQVETLKKQLKEANDEKKKAERKRDVSEQRRCDAILEQGRIQTEADELATAVKKLTKAAQKGQQLDKGDVHKALRPVSSLEPRPQPRTGRGVENVRQHHDLVRRPRRAA